MKSITSHNILNRIPIISITHKGLEAIKEIVRIAPQEAQWFHTVEPLIYKKSPDQVYLKLSEKIYIPTQNTSAVQVDTTSSMMIDFYNELKNDYEDQAVVNEKLSAMTCWCHSHVNMNPSPSGQDDSQFNSFINLDQDQNIERWQIMLIFNKKDQFYSRVYDPATGTIHEGVPIHVLHDYDFSYIHAAAKTKFIKPKPSKGKFTNWKNHSFWNKTRTASKAQPIYNDPLDEALFTTNHNVFKDESEVNEEIISSILNDAFDNYNVYETPKNQFNQFINLTEHNLLKLHDALFASLDDRETTFFVHFATEQQKKIPPIFLEPSFERKFPTESDIFTFFKENLINKTLTIQEAYDSLLKTLEIVDLTTRKECKEYIDNDGVI